MPYSPSFAKRPKQTQDINVTENKSMDANALPSGYSSLVSMMVKKVLEWLHYTTLVVFPSYLHISSEDENPSLNNSPLGGTFILVWGSKTTTHGASLC